MPLLVIDIRLSLSSSRLDDNGRGRVMVCDDKDKIVSLSSIIVYKAPRKARSSAERRYNKTCDELKSQIGMECACVCMRFVRVHPPLLLRICGPFAPSTPNIAPMKLDDVPVQPSNQSSIVTNVQVYNRKSKQTCNKARGNQTCAYIISMGTHTYTHTSIDGVHIPPLIGISERDGCTLSVE